MGKAGLMKTTFILSDTQYPYHDKLMLKKMVKVVKDLQPDHIFSIGDLIDFPQISRWTKGSAGEYVDTLQEHIDGARTSVLEPLREAAPAAKFSWLEANHEVRIKDFVGKYAYPLTSLRALSMENLFNLDELNIQYVKGPVNIGTNVYALHGHEPGGYVSNIAAWDAKLAKRYGSDKSYVMGHSHQPGISTRAYGFNGKVSPRFTMNVGSIMNPSKVDYVRDGAVSWVQSFALLHDDGKRVYPELILANDRGFMLNGKRY